ncbi:hypothetical protein WJU23_18240 [Prosthecobacter sp. SYSU 5D2]|uniref:hypothetical protein n=1 Tax=Prosthecobacter sp. SYSU 5D2 TaxID=3134134 RepID=UPI0031FE8336
MLETQSIANGPSFLSPAEIQEYYESVMAGPFNYEGEQVVKEPYVQIFQRKQLHPIRSLLCGYPLENFGALAKDNFDLQMTSYKQFSSGGEMHEITHVAPKEADGLAEMTEDELWSFLNTWKPATNRFDSDQWWIEEHVSALGRKFAHLLQSEPARFQASREWWRNLMRPDILYPPLEMATVRISDQTDVHMAAQPPSQNEWRNWFGLVEWIASSGTTDAEESGDPLRTEGDDWNWARIIAVKFLAATITPRFPVPENLRSQIGILIRQFVVAPDKRLDSSDKTILKDWFTTAINSVRGTAVEQLMRLALQQKIDRNGQSPDDWVWVLIRDLLVKDGPSQAVFSIMGARLNIALHLFAEQFKREPFLLLPGPNSEAQIAFILALTKYSQAQVALIETLPAFPTSALECLVQMNAKGLLDREQQSGDFGAQLGTHLAYYFWNDAYPSSSDGDAIIERYFAVAEPSQRSRAISSIANIFRKAQAEQRHERCFQRARDLWDRRFSIVTLRRTNSTYSAEDVHEELSAFVEWLSCECHPFEWRYERVLQALRLIERAPQSSLTMQTLEKLSQDPVKLGPCIEILELILSKETRILSWTYREDEIKPLLARGSIAREAAVVARTQRIQDILLRHGMFSYLDLGSQV